MLQLISDMTNALITLLRDTSAVLVDVVFLGLLADLLDHLHEMLVAMQEQAVGPTRTLSAR